MSYTITWRDAGLLVEFSDTVTSKEFIEAKAALTEDPRYQKISYLLVDFLSISKFEVDANAIRTIAQMDMTVSENNQNVNVAIITKKDIIIGFARMYELSGAGTNWNIEIFEEKKSAYHWLGIAL